MEKRYIVMNISSRSCIYCLMQEKKMQKDKVLQERLKNEVYFLSWQTEQQVCFIFNGQKYASGEEFIENYGRDENGTIAIMETYAALSTNPVIMLDLPSRGQNVRINVRDIKGLHFEATEPAPSM